MTYRRSLASGTGLRRDGVGGRTQRGWRRRSLGWHLASLGVPLAAALLAGFLGVGLISSGLGARTACADEPAKGPDDLEIYLGEDILIADLLRAVTRQTHRPIVWSDGDKAVTGKKIQGTLSIRTPKDKLFDTIRGLLTFQEIVLIPIGAKGYEVWVAMDARTLASQFILKNKPVYMELDDAKATEIESQDGLFVATNIKVENIDNLRDARTALQRIVTANNIGNVQEVPAARSFVVTDFAPNVVAIYRLIRQMDVKPKGKTVRQEFIPLTFALAEDIEPILQELFTGKQRVSAPQPNQPGGGEITDPEARIMADPRTNTIIVYATEDDILEITALIKHLDVQLLYQKQIVHVIQLKNLDATDTAQVLQTLIDGTSLFGSSSGSTSGGNRGSGRSGAGISRTTTTTVGRVAPGNSTVAPSSPDLEEKPAVVADKASNSLIIAASQAQFDRLKLVVEQIDVRKAQVLIEAALVELSLNDSYRFAVELAGIDNNGLEPNGSASLFGATHFGLTQYADRNGDGLFTDRLPPFISDGGQGPTGAVGGIFAAGQVPFIYRALNNNRRSRVLQLPSIVTTDNEEATIKVLDEQATTDSTVTSGGNTSGGFQGFQEAGTTLSISPHIANDQYLLLNINLEVSGFKGEPKTLGTIQIPADKFRRNIQTAVVVPDRHTVVIGGLIGNIAGGDVDQVPYLGEIPIFGNLFKSTVKTDQKTNLFLFVTPTILRKEDQAFKDYDDVTCVRKRKADALIGQVDIPFRNFVGCPSSAPACGCPTTDPATGCARGYGSASDRLDRLGALDATQFRGVDKSRLAAEAEARRRALEQGPGTTPCATPSGHR